MDFNQKTWQDDQAGGTPITAAELNRVEQGIKDAEGEVNLNSAHRLSPHAPADADNTATNETSHAAETAHRTGDGSDHADVVLNSTHRLSAHAPANADNTASNETSHADVVTDGDFAANGILIRTGAGAYGSTADNSANWDAAHTHSQAAHAPANADNTAANETSHAAEAAHRTGDGSDHSQVAANATAINGKADKQTGITTIASGATCVIDYGTGAMVYKHTVTENVTLSLINLPVSGTWGVILMLTNGGAFSVGYSTDWKEAGGTALTLTSAGTDRLVITGEGQDATTVIITVVEADVK